MQHRGIKKHISLATVLGATPQEEVGVSPLKRLIVGRDEGVRCA